MDAALRTRAIVVVALLTGACRPRDEGGGGGPQVAPPQAPPSPIVIAPGGGPGGTQVRAGGQDVWPPRGPGCEGLVACCEQAARDASDVALFCQMSVATPPLDCARALTQVRTYLGERGLAPPPACQGGAPAPPPVVPRPPAVPPPAAPSPPIACAQDADCPHLSCGPCRSGASLHPHGATRFAG